jgi:hypothetical protein
MVADHIAGWRKSCLSVIPKVKPRFGEQERQTYTPWPVFFLRFVPTALSLLSD